MNLQVNAAKEFAVSSEPTQQKTVYTEEEKEHFMSVFSLFDKQKNGTIQIEDLSQIMKSLKRSMSNIDQITKDILEDRKSESDAVDFEGFLETMAKLEERINEENQKRI